MVGAGIPRTREIYEQGIKSLNDVFVKELGQKYAALERRLGEIDRARAIYTYTSQFCDPKVTAAATTTTLSRIGTARLRGVTHVLTCLCLLQLACSPVAEGRWLLDCLA